MRVVVCVLLCTRCMVLRGDACVCRSVCLGLNKAHGHCDCCEAMHACACACLCVFIHEAQGHCDCCNAMCACSFCVCMSQVYARSHGCEACVYEEIVCPQS